jgi:hypothetical protein
MLVESSSIGRFVSSTSVLRFFTKVGTSSATVIAHKVIMPTHRQPLFLVETY